MARERNDAWESVREDDVTRTRLFVYQIISVLYEPIDRPKRPFDERWIRFDSITVVFRPAFLGIARYVIRFKRFEETAFSNKSRKDADIWPRGSRCPAANYRALIDAASRSLRVYH